MSDDLGPDEYRCAECGGVFAKGQSDEAAEAEYRAEFPRSAAAGAARAIVCDDCYKAFVAWVEMARATFPRPAEDRS